MGKIINDNKISVVIPTFNRANRIEACIDSIINQTQSVFEIIVVDDCSTDNTSAIVARYQEKHGQANIVYERLKMNGGAQKARNRGIELAKGKWICFCDSDDEWLENKIAIQFAALKSIKFYEYVVIHGDCEVHNTKTNTHYVWHLPVVHGKTCYKTLLQRPVPMFQAMLTSKKALLEVGKLGEDIKSYQEWDTSLRLATKCEFIHIDKPLFVYNIHNEGQISDNVKKDFDGYEYILDKYKEDILSICGIAAWNRHIISLLIRAMEERRDYIEHIVKKLIIRNLSEKKIIMFGCGQDGIWIEVVLRTVGVKIVAYVDNGTKKFLDNNVCSLDEIRKKDDEVFFITTEKYQDDIAQQLDDAGYKKEIDYIKFSDVFW